MINIIPVKSIDLNDNIEAFKKQLITKNHYIQGSYGIIINNKDKNRIQMEIMHIGWLVILKDYMGLLMIKFMNLIVTNNTIQKDIVQQSQSLTNRLYYQKEQYKICKKY